MKTIHKAIDTILSILWLSLFIIAAINGTNILIKIASSLAAFLIAAYFFMNILYGIVRYKPNNITLSIYILLICTNIPYMLIYNINIYNILILIISIFSILQYIVNKRIEKLK